MIQHEFHAHKIWQGLALHRFNIHLEEVKRELLPVLEEVYNFGYDRGVADRANDLSEMPTPKPVSDGMLYNENTILPEMSSENPVGTEG